MTYRGKMAHGVVVLEGDKPADGTWVDVTPADPATDKSLSTAAGTRHPAFGIWKDRTDLPPDPVEASRLLREQMMRRANTAQT